MENSELISFKDWCKEHTTRHLYEGIELAIENYSKEINSNAHAESQNVSENEDEKKICYQMRKEYLGNHVFRCRDCGKHLRSLVE